VVMKSRRGPGAAKARSSGSEKGHQRVQPERPDASLGARRRSDRLAMAHLSNAAGGGASVERGRIRCIKRRRFRRGASRDSRRHAACAVE